MKYMNYFDEILLDIAIGSLVYQMDFCPKQYGVLVMVVNESGCEAIGVTVWKSPGSTRPVEMHPDAGAQLFTACLCYNSRE